jgi:hypothetical protein
VQQFSTVHIGRVQADLDRTEEKGNFREVAWADVGAIGEVDS